MAGTAPEQIIARRYRLRAVIGSGGMGVVWRAHDEVLGRDVAVKEIVWPPEMGPDERETARSRAIREAQLAARLHHPNIIAIYDILEEDDRPWIVMQLFLPHRSLRDAIHRDGPLSPVDAARVGLGVLAALQAAHEAGILHRDVKPANILLGPDDRAILTDFGIAKATDSPTLTRSGMLIGSPSYIAPERARGLAGGAAADLWAVGASLYTAVEGRPPFERDGALASLIAVVNDEPDPPVNAGPLEPVIRGLLRKDPGNRLGVDDAAHMMRGIVDGTSQVTPYDGAPDEPEVIPPPRNSDYRALLTAFALIVLAAGAIIIAVLAARSPSHVARSAALRTSQPHPTAPARTTPAPPPSRPSVATSGTPGNGTSGTPGNGTSGTPGNGTSGTPGNGTAPPGNGTAPPGYYTFTNPTGFSIAVPYGWQIAHVGHYVYVRDPANSGIFLLIDQSDQPKLDPLADWRQQAANRASSYPGYHLILLRSVQYPQAEKAADWEFSYVRDGVPVRILNRNVLANAHHAYALYWSTPTSDWDAYYHYFQVFAASFRPAS